MPSLVLETTERLPRPTPEAVREGWLTQQGLDSWPQDLSYAFHSRVLLTSIVDVLTVHHLARCLRRGIDPDTMSRPRNEARALEAREKTLIEIHDKGRRYLARLNEYGSVFGWGARDWMRQRALHHALDCVRDRDSCEDNGQMVLLAA